VCNKGWIMDASGEEKQGGCLDIDECSADLNICKINQFCVNNEGSYTCLECDKACDGGCHGDGPDMCEKCASGFELRDGICTGE
jgi:protein disulfide-isomerase